MDPTQQSQDDGFERQWYSYVFDATTTASVVQQQGQLQIQTDADFEWWWLVGSATAPTQLKVLIKEAATGRDFIGTTANPVSGAGAFNGINFNLLCGLASASAAFPLAVPFVMPASRTYSIYLTDSSAAPQTVELVFSGFKLWQKSTATPAAGSSGAQSASGH